MIERLAGSIVHRRGNTLVIDVDGVGYGVEVAEATARRMAAVSAETQTVLWIYTHVREDALRLFGFCSLEERELFELLLSVSGVGPRIAMLVLGHLSPHALATAIISENAEALTEVPGVGAKQSQKIILDLKPKLQKLSDAGRLPKPTASIVTPLFAEADNQGKSIPANIAQDLRSALANLGYKEKEISQALKKIAWEAGSSFDSHLRAVITMLSKGARRDAGASKLDEIF